MIISVERIDGSVLVTIQTNGGIQTGKLVDFGVPEIDYFISNYSKFVLVEYVADGELSLPPSYIYEWCLYDPKDNTLSVKYDEYDVSIGGDYMRYRYENYSWLRYRYYEFTVEYDFETLFRPGLFLQKIWSPSWDTALLVRLEEFDNKHIDAPNNYSAFSGWPNTEYMEYSQSDMLIDVKSKLM